MREGAGPKVSSGRCKVDTTTLLIGKVDAQAQRLDKFDTFSPVGVYTACETYSMQGHTSVEYYNDTSTTEHANAVHNLNPPPQCNTYCDAYNTGWKSHPNPLYKHPATHPQSSMQWPGFQHRAPYNPLSPPLQLKSNLKSFMDHFIAPQTKTNEALGECINQITFKFDAITSHQKVMDTHIS